MSILAVDRLARRVSIAARVMCVIGAASSTAAAVLAFLDRLYLPGAAMAFFVLVAAGMFLASQQAARARVKGSRHPDYARIAGMELEIYGEAFSHDGAPGVACVTGRTASGKIRLGGHDPDDPGHCWMCQDRYLMQELGRKRRASECADLLGPLPPGVHYHD